MIVRFDCWLVLLAVYCVALVDSIGSDEIEFDNNTFVDNNKFIDNVPFQSDCDCGSHTKSCSYVEGKKKCNVMICMQINKGHACLATVSMPSITNGCEFDDFGRKKCNCLKGYVN
ncbi:hypothetical protein JTE90_023129 [Oedothorax gibbosus]|uniref:Uncharacterized protein n=1 Tax=Oedothorax gibbosus TaxID=931172 RepID=A0AAV6TLL1_9ARAC|nr:hypothetical protein JTE90_023129 [Oedothorax gibbosus]